MSVYLVSYDLYKEGTDYDSLYEKLKNYTAWWHFLESTWMITTHDSSSKVKNNLRKVMDNNDSLLIIEVKNNYSGWLPEEAWEWMRNNIV